MGKIKIMRRGDTKLKKVYWRPGKSKYMFPRAEQEGLINSMWDVHDFGGLKDALENKILKND